MFTLNQIDWIGASQLRSVTEIAPKSPFLCVPPILSVVFFPKLEHKRFLCGEKQWESRERFFVINNIRSGYSEQQSYSKHPGLASRSKDPPCFFRIWHNFLILVNFYSHLSYYHNNGALGYTRPISSSQGSARVKRNPASKHWCQQNTFSTLYQRKRN